MANTKQAQKMTRKIERRTRYNRWWKQKIKFAKYQLDEAIQKEGKAPEANVDKIYQQLQKFVDKAAKNGVVHKRKANRIKSRYSARISKSK